MDKPEVAVDSNELEDAIREEILDEIADLEEYAKLGKRPPRACRGYRVRINSQRHVFHKPAVTGREVLEKAMLTPVERYKLRLIVRGGQRRKVKLDDVVDLTQPGVERFRASSRDQTEG